METWEENTEDNLTLIRTANDCIEEAVDEPELKPLFGTLWQSGELTFLAGDTGKGKTILAVAIADALTKSKDKLLGQEIEYQGTVLYYDFELSDRQFRKRYQSYRFDNQFYRVVINPSYLGTDLFSIDTIESDVEATGAKIIIIDNITALALKSTQSQDEALSLMRGLKKLALQGLSILVLAHTPKIAEGRKLSINHLAGSKHLSNFADSVFFIGYSNENPDYRYLKQVKCRNADQLHDVIVCELVNDKGYLSFEFVKYDREETHIVVPIAVAGIEITAEMQKAYELHKQGKSLRAIAKELGVGKSTVDRWLKQRPLSQSHENSEFKGMGQARNDHGTEGQIYDGTENEKKNREENEQGTKGQEGQEASQMPQGNTEKKTGRKDYFKPEDLRRRFFELDDDEFQNELDRMKKERSEQNGQSEDGTEGQKDKPKRVPVTVVNKYGRKLETCFPDLHEKMYGPDWINTIAFLNENERHSEQQGANEPEEEEKKGKPEYSYHDKGKVDKTNKELEKWIMKLIRLHQRGDKGVAISELKEFAEETKKYQESYDYRNLPVHYEYMDFINEFVARIQRGVIKAKVDKMKVMKLNIEESYIDEMQKILFEIATE